MSQEPPSNGQTTAARPTSQQSRLLPVATVLWVLGVVALGFARRDELVRLPLPAIGDFLAGAFAPLAFLWLVYGYFMQANELRLQRQQLRAQRKELKLQRKAQSASSKSLKSQAESMAAQIRLLAEQGDLARQQFNAGSAPDIDAQHAGSVDGRQEFKLTNHGATARDLHFKSWTGGWRALFNDKAPARLSHGESIVYAFTCTVPPTDQFQFTISYSVGTITIEERTFRWSAAAGVVEIT